MVGKTIHSKERALILKVLAFFEREKEISNFVKTKSTYEASEYEKVIKKFIISVDQPINRTCAATGVSKRTLMRIKKEVKPVAPSMSPGTSTSTPIPRPSTPGKKRKQSYKKINLDNFELVALRNLVNSFYTIRKEVPTLKKILAAAKKDLNFPAEKTTLRLILKNQLGYRFKKCKNARLVLIQKPDIAACRARYLRRMKENNDLGADKKPVTYLDSHSQLIDSHAVNLVHAGGENGFIGDELLYKCKSKTGDHHDEMDAKHFVKWLNEKLLPNLPPNGIVVINNAPCLTQSDKIPSQSSLKSEMQSWLTKNNINFDERMTKPELYQIIKVNKPKKDYVIDVLLREHNHEVLRLPPYHCDLNPIEYIWRLVKQRVVDKNNDQPEIQIEQLTREAIQSITVADWRKEVNHVRRLEEGYWLQDRLQEIHEREFIMSLGGEESSDSQTEEDESDTSIMSGIEELDDD